MMSKITKKNLLSAFKKYHLKNKESIQLVNNRIDDLPVSSNPNLLINGDFQVWQRGDSITITSSKYTADRWISPYVSQLTVSKQTSTYGNVLRVVSNKSGDSAWLYQPIENFDYLVGKTITVSFMIRGINSFSGSMTSRTGTSGAKNINITSEWQKVQYTTVVQNNTGAGLTHTRGVLIATLQANLPNVGQGYEIAQVKLELGSVATPFVPRTYAEELSECQRYYQKITSYRDFFIGRTHAVNSTFVMNLKLSIPMRISPTISSGKTKFVLFGEWEKTFDNKDIVFNAMPTGSLTSNEIDISENPFQTGYSILNGYFLEDVYLDAEIY